MNTERVLNITRNEKGHMYAMAQKRKQFITYLNQHEHESNMEKNDENKI